MKDHAIAVGRVFLLAALLALLSTACTWKNVHGVTPIYPKLTVTNIGEVSITESFQPTFRWEPVEEPDVQYDFIIYESGRLPLHYRPENWSVGSEVYYREGLKEAEHKLEEPLKPHRGYYWSVRVRRGENVSDWSRFTDYACYGYYSRCGIYKYPFFVFQTPSKTLSAQVSWSNVGDTPLTYV